MNPMARALADLAAALDERGRSWALVGGLAVSAHVDPRFTRDIDVAVAVADDEDAEALVHTFVTSGYDVQTAIEQVAVGRLATIRLVARRPGSGDVLVDLIFASCGIEAEVCADADRLEVLPGVVVPVASRASLIAMKLLSVNEARLQDALDLRALLANAPETDLASARAAAALITARGFNRGRDLETQLMQYLQRS